MPKVTEVNKEMFRDVGSRLKRLRLERGLNQNRLCNMAGVAHRTITDLEEGLRYPGGRTVAKLSQALGVSVEELTGKQAPGWLDEFLDGSPESVEDLAPEDAAGLRSVAESGEPLAWFGGELPEVPVEAERLITSLSLENRRLKERVRELEAIDAFMGEQASKEKEVA